MSTAPSGIVQDNLPAPGATSSAGAASQSFTGPVAPVGVNQVDGSSGQLTDNSVDSRERNSQLRRMQETQTDPVAGPMIAAQASLSDAAKLLPSEIRSQLAGATGSFGLLNDVCKLGYDMGDHLDRIRDNTRACMTAINQQNPNLINDPNRCSKISSYIGSAQGLHDSSISSIATGIGSILSALASIPGAIINAAMSALNGLISTITGAISGAVSGAVDAIGGVLKPIIGAVKSAFGAVTSLLGSSVNGLFGSVSSAVNSLSSAVKSESTALTNALNDSATRNPIKPVIPNVDPCIRSTLASAAASNPAPVVAVVPGTAGLG